MVTDIYCIPFSYEDAEKVMKEWNPDCEPMYEGAIVRGCVDGEPYDFAYILNEVFPEMGISPNAVSIYCEVGYIYTHRGIDIIVIDGIQEEQ